MRCGGDGFSDVGAFAAGGGVEDDVKRAGDLWVLALGAGPFDGVLTACD